MVMEPVLRFLSLSCRMARQLPGRVQVAVDDVVELAVVADDDHALADLAVFDRSHAAKPPSAKWRRPAPEPECRCQVSKRRIA